MQLKDNTSLFGSVGLLIIPLILIFLTADSALACPGHKTGVAYRTRAINTKTITPATVISYRAPASYRRCGNNLYDTRGAKYVSVRQNGSSAKFVAVRNNVPRTRFIAVRNETPRTRYVAVRKVKLDDDLRYVDLSRNPVYAESGTSAIAVRSGYRKGNGIVAYVRDEPSYVAVRRVAPRTRYVAVRDIDIDDDAPRYVAVRRIAPRTRYVAVRNIDSGCTRAVALRRCLDQVETTSVSRVVLRNDDDAYAVPTRHVVLRDDIDDDIVENDIDVDDEYITVSSATPKYIEYTPAAYSNGNGVTYIAANDLTDTCSRTVALRTCPEAVSTRTITYEVSDDDDWDDQAFLHRDATYVAAGNVKDACMPSQVVYTSPAVVSTRAVSYVPAAYVDEDASFLGSEPTYVMNDDAALVEAEPAFVASAEPGTAVVSQPRWVAMDEDELFNDLDPTWIEEVEATSGAGTVSYVPGGDVEVMGSAVAYVPVDDVEDLNTQTVSYVPVDEVEEMDTQTVSYVPVDDVEDLNTQTVSYVPVDEVEEMDTQTVSYVPVDEVEEMDTQTVSYVPVDDVEAETVSYLPVNNVEYVEVANIATDACPMLVSGVDAETVYVANVSDELVADLGSTRQIAGNFGYRDGFEDGQEAALEGDLYHPENSGDYQKATEGYEDDFGDKDVYKDSYRSSYLAGYRAGFESGSSV